MYAHRFFAQGILFREETFGSSLFYKIKSVSLAHVVQKVFPSDNINLIYDSGRV